MESGLTIARVATLGVAVELSGADAVDTRGAGTDEMAMLGFHPVHLEKIDLAEAALLAFAGSEAFFTHA